MMEGQILSHYKVLEKLGGGGMGVVYKALDTKLNRQVALKFLPPELTRDDDARDRFILEAQAASALDHPNICTIHEIDATPDGQQFIAMAYYEGETLKKRLEHGPLPVEEALDVAIQIAQGLNKAHDANIIHRDIKPANVMLTRDGFVKIVDFGIAKLLGVTGPTQTGTTLGTVSYMSPEQAAGEDADQQSDVWALGAVLYEMLTGCQPFKGENQWAVMDAIRNRDPESPSLLRSEVSPRVRNLVLRALQKPKDKRYTSGSAFLADARASHTDLTRPTPTNAAFGPWQALLTPKVVMPAVIVLLVIGAAAFWSVRSDAGVRWAREEAIPRISQLVEVAEYTAAFALAEEAEQYLPNDPFLTELWNEIAIPGSVVTNPSDVAVSYRPYGAADDDAWQYLGQSPLERVRLPRGVFEWRFERDGFGEQIWAAANPSLLLRNLGVLPDTILDVEVTLDQTGTLPVGMLRVPALTGPVSITGFPSDQFVSVDDFLIDRYEVTNRQFKQFVDAGGYQNREYWEGLRFVRDGQEISWDEAMDEFRDATGRPGPAAWELGDYPDGQADHPVGGVSWYEARAFANFVGKSLPTIYHWAAAALAPGEIISPIGPAIVPLSNFESDEAMPVGTIGGIGPYGTYDTAGNVREWCLNASGDLRWILGGAWSDPQRMFSIRLALPPFDRSPLNGFRTVQHPQGATVSASLEEPVDFAYRDYRNAEAVSDEVFDVFARQLSYEPTPAGTVTEVTEEGSDDWVREKVSLNAGYEGERLTAFLYLPKDAPPPFQAVILFPGLGPFMSQGSSDGLARGPGVGDFIVKSGRVFVRPVWNGSYERWDPFLGLGGEEYQRTFRRRVSEWRQELGQLVDYLVGRPDIDPDGFAYFGTSFGGSTPLALLAVETRFKAAVLRSGGFPYREIPPEVDPVNFVGRITLPVLMVNGRYDYVFSLDTAQRPLFERFGTPPGNKSHEILEAGHAPIPRSQLIQLTLDWLDRYVGPVG